MAEIGKDRIAEYLNVFCTRAIHALTRVAGQAKLVQKLSRSFCIRAIHALTRVAGQAKLVQKLSRSFCRTAGVLIPLIELGDKF
ncbi:hypothetical protein [Paraglaciecola arctica]|uniref:hypothetical protein n=1 Tax=Paraglaciecola arctica TaxID=1128911 RepID=UPI00129BF7F6|nr:hypothetical protein [Paraglaciecola arctica]